MRDAHFCRIILGSPNGSGSLQPGDHRVVVPAGAVDDEQLPVLVPAAHDAHVGVLRVKHQVAGLGILPVDRLTVAVLGGEAAAIANHIFNLSLGM